jgi:hypothetical protein
MPRSKDFIAMSKIKLDLSSQEITARLKRACGLGDAELRATTIRNLMTEIKPESSASIKPRKKKKTEHARIHS